MKSGEFIEAFLNRFLHLCYEFSVKYFNYNFISEKFKSLIIFSMKSFAYEPFNDSPPSTYVETPQICKEEPAIPFVPCPCPFPVSIWVPLGENIEVGKSKNQMDDPSLQPSSIYHDPNPMDETLEWFMEPKVKNNPSILQEDTNTHRFNPKSDLDTCHPLSSLSHDPFPIDLIDQYHPQPSSEQV